MKTSNPEEYLFWRDFVGDIIEKFGITPRPKWMRPKKTEIKVDKLDIALDNIWNNYLRRAEKVSRIPGAILISGREDAKLAFKRQIREAIT